MFVGSSGGSYGFGVEGSAQVGKGYENSDSVTQVNSMIQANKVEARSGQDMSLKGVVVTGNKVAVEVGNNFISKAVKTANSMRANKHKPVYLRLSRFTAAVQMRQ